ncbi:hypothetical protein pipiens_003235 [Culex pipiens pipiens]|uniref:Uncharacterized protein n=1 Tax=Culex pipiens pipiens TaxID=38569 RepID=A0ABD1D1I0_CULPP
MLVLQVEKQPEEVPALLKGIADTDSSTPVLQHDIYNDGMPLNTTEDIDGVPMQSSEEKLKTGGSFQAAAGYAHVFVENRFQMDMLMDLNKEYLREMGTTMGDFIAILCHSKTVCNQSARDRVLSSQSGGFRHAEQPTQIGGVPPQLGGVSAEQIAERLFRAQNHTSGWRRIYHEHCAHRRSVA